MIRRPCLDCGKAAIVTMGRCPTCYAARTQARDAQRGTRTQRGYGYAHVARRARLLPLAINTPCPRCGRTMYADQQLDLGHTVPLRTDPTSKADRIEHARCNRAAKDD